MNYHNIYVPYDNDWANLKLAEKSVQNKNPQNIVFDLDNPMDVLESEVLICKMRSFVLYNYLQSDSAFWKPTDQDEVYHVNVPYCSEIFELKVECEKNIPNQYSYFGNCFKTKAEAEKLKEGIWEILKKWRS